MPAPSTTRTAGGDDTQDRRLDDAVKYDPQFADTLHFAVQYKFPEHITYMNPLVPIGTGLRFTF
jgi:hypothetical protein